MRAFRPWRLATACRLVLFLSFFVSATRSAEAAIIAGRVIDPDGRGVAGARVVVANAIGSVADRATDAQGTFEIAALPAGQYVVRVVADGFQAEPVTLTLREDERHDVDVALRVSALAESIVVSASQIDLPLSRAPDSVTVITAADLAARQIETVADALRLVPGLSVTRSGGRGGRTALFPRGGASNYTLVLVDGMRANAFGGGYDFGHLSVGDVERIEIVRGPQSAVFGSDAIGAVVQIITRRGGAPRGDGLLEGGSQNTVRAAASTAGSTGAWTWGAGAERRQSDGYTGIAPATGERVTNDDDQVSHASGTLGWRRPDGPDVVVSANIDRDERGFPGPYGSNPIGAFTGVDRISRGVNDTRQIGSRVTHPWSSTVRQRLEANYTTLSGDFTSPFGPSASGTRRFDGRIQEDAAFTPDLGASAGIEVIRERGSSTYVTGAAGQPIPIDRSVLGAYAELRYARRERLFVTAGARLDRLTRDRVEPDAFSTRPEFPAQIVNSFNPKIAVSYTLARAPDRGTSTRLHATTGTGIRPPDAFEIAFTNNPTLQPERSRSFDAGIEQQFGGGAYAVGATAFFNRYDDLIVTVGRSLRDASRYATDNISNARARGLELSGDVRLGAGVTLRANYTFLDSEILSVDTQARLAPPPFQVGDALLRRPRQQGHLDLTYAAGRFTAFGELTTRSRILDVEPSFGASGGLFFSPGYSVVNTGISVRIARGLTGFARVLNLADRRYEETLGFPALGRSGMVGVRVAASR